jgi:hypothetical protein
LRLLCIRHCPRELLPELIPNVDSGCVVCTVQAKGLIVGGGKAVVDVLVARGLLKDDSPKWFEGIYQQVPGDADAIVLTIYDIL